MIFKDDITSRVIANDNPITEETMFDEIIRFKDRIEGNSKVRIKKRFCFDNLPFL